MKNTSKICVEILNEATRCCINADALYLGDGTYKILLTNIYDPEDEWAFKPGAIVRCAMRDNLSENPVFAAVEQVGFEAP